MQDVIKAIAKQIGDLGYQVSEGKGYVLAKKPGTASKVDFKQGDEEERYKAYCELAQAVGIDLEG